MMDDKAKRKNLVNISKILRRNMTRDECHLWYDFLKNFPIPIYRQKIIGDYIVDFYCAQAKVVIELDGSQHKARKAKDDDFLRDEYLKSQDILVLRYSNSAIRSSFPTVCEDILKQIEGRTSL